jgi:hypothetical protein
MAKYLNRGMGNERVIVSVGLRTIAVIVVGPTEFWVGGDFCFEQFLVLELEVLNAL